jgi:uncharacterized protein with PIN domain
MLSQTEDGDKEAPPRLFVDAMLGRLARWLRLMGYDAAYYRTGSDEELARQAHAEGRLILTRDRGLAGRRGVRAMLINSDDIDGQIAEVRAVLAILGGEPEPFSRCSECNGQLADLAPDQAGDLVPPYVWHTQQTFKRCPDCGRVYWKGTHWPGMQERLRDDNERAKDED